MRWLSLFTLVFVCAACQGGADPLPVGAPSAQATPSPEETPNATALSSMGNAASPPRTLDPECAALRQRLISVPAGEKLDQVWPLRSRCPDIVLQAIQLSLPALEGSPQIEARIRQGILQAFWLEPRQELAAVQSFELAAQAADQAQDPCLWIWARKFQAEVMFRDGPLASADAYIAQALTRLSACTDPQRRAVTLHMTAEVRRRQDRPTEAWEALEEAISGLRAAGQETLFYELKEAELRHDLGDISDEGLRYEELLVRAEASSPDLIPELGLDIAYLRRDLGDLEGARKVLLRTLERVGKEPAWRDERLNLLTTLAWVELDRGELAQAEARLREAPLEALDDPLPRHFWMFVMGSLRLAQGNLPEARQLFERVLNEPCMPEPRWRSRLGLAMVDLAEGRAQAAQTRLWEAVRQVEQERQSTLETFWSLAYQSQRYGLYERWLESLVEAWERTGRRSSSAAKTWDPARAFTAGPVTADDLLAAVEKVSSQAFLAELFRDRGGLPGLLASSQNRQTLQGVSQGWQGGAQLRQTLPEGVPVIALMPLPSRVLVLEVRRTEVRVHLVPLDRRSLERLVHRVRESLEDDPDRVPAELETLGEALLAPLAGRLPPDAGPVGFIPGGILESLPLAALRVGGRYLVERAAPFELSNLSTLLASAAQPRPRAPLKALAVSFGPGLSHATAEANLLRQSALATTLLTDRQATRSAVLKAMPGKQVLHFATHGRGPGSTTALASRGQAGRLEQAQLELSDGGLTALELQGQSIRAWLAVLAGCETYVGRPVPTENGYGALHRAFLLAGAEAAVASRWKVGDEATLALMRGLYGHLLENGRAGGLATAQRAMIASSRVARAIVRKHVTLLPGGQLQTARNIKDVRYSAPWSWAAFTLVGRWD